MIEIGGVIEIRPMVLQQTVLLESGIPFPVAVGQRNQRASQGVQGPLVVGEWKLRG